MFGKNPQNDEQLDRFGKLVLRAAELGYHAIAITDRNSVAAASANDGRAQLVR